MYINLATTAVVHVLNLVPTCRYGTACTLTKVELRYSSYYILNLVLNLVKSTTRSTTNY
jgi:hypothetical protein